ncbi:Lipid A 3-O-deacylase (PagL) [Saccharicrinis carchari]|uniref:Lipid A 3-O-deacylase (PagL) n=1 Tax=Saccharicrinis carchari TaxID=1168039 RepID=A0A521BX15_SACCC|nr:acyloxyacyl hydrolase [Saccharicrinis carchari]SMO51747.1 Lipid A 3-O-deacylase (PagL) [Saccharicrinis carchari]
MRGFLKWCIGLLFMSYGTLYAQDSEPTNQFRFFEIKGHSGAHLYTGEKLKEALENGYGAIEVRYGWQSNNPDAWQSYFAYPAYGIGWYSGFIGNPDLLGQPGAFYGFISFPLLKPNRHQMVIEPAFGLSYDLNPYNPETNISNDAIGSRFNVYFNLNLGAKYRLNREMDLIYGLDFTHFSNGRMFKPNAGLNMWGLNLGFRYHFNAQQKRVDNAEFPQQILNVRPKPIPKQKAPSIRKSTIAVYGAGGLVQNDENSGTTKQYVTVSTMAEYMYILNAKSGFAVGLDAFYDSSLEKYFPNDNLYFFGFHGGYDLMFWKMALRFQVGSYLHQRARKYKGKFFIRPALKFHATEHLFAQIGLKTQDGFKADWIELGLGVRLW